MSCRAALLFISVTAFITSAKRVAFSSQILAAGKKSSRVRVSNLDVQRLGRKHESSKRTQDLSGQRAAFWEQKTTCDICTGEDVLQQDHVADDASGATCQAVQEWLNTAEATMSCSEGQATFKDKCCKDKSVDKNVLDALGPELKNDLIHIFGEERMVQILDLQRVEFAKDKITTGYAEIQEDVMKRQKTMLTQVAERAADMRDRACSQLPDSVLSHLWRYNEEDVLKCLGGGQTGAKSLLQTTDCNGQDDEIPGSSGIFWTFSPCTDYGGHVCTLANGTKGCCCPAGRRWHAGTCAECGAPSDIKEGDKCELRCALLPDEVAHLKCGSSVMLEASVPSGQCRWRRDQEVVETDAGPVQGFVRPVLWNWDWSQYEVGAESLIEVAYVRTFWDIPFGNPIEMFKRPLKVDSWGPEVLQSPDFYEDNFAVKDCDTEDHDACLTLAVYVPPDTTMENRKPVLFWIPGDGFQTADVWSKGTYDGARLAIRQDCLLVISNGRSSLLGHWASFALVEEDKEDRSTGNYGLMDQRLALQWIQANIANFGGDPSRVTIAGHSSGGFSVNFHLFSPHSRKLFSAAIAEGSTLDSPWYMQDLSESNDFYAELGEAMGCPKDQPVEQIECLRKLKKSDFKKFKDGQMSILGEDIKERFTLWTGVNTATQYLLSTFGFEGEKPVPPIVKPGYVRFKTAPVWPLLPIGPCVDGSQAGLPEPPMELMKDNSKVAQVPVYLSYAKDEGSVFSLMIMGSYPWTTVPVPTHAGVDEIVKWFSEDDEFAEQVIEHYPHKMGSPHARLSEMVGDSIFKCSNHRFAKVTAAQKTAQPVYLAETDYIEGQANTSWLPNTQSIMGKVFGAWHMTASGYVFDVGPFDDATRGISMLVNCHYGFFLHCRDPQITKETKCFHDKIGMLDQKPKAKIRACLDKHLHLKSFDWERPFRKFDPDSPEKYIFNEVPATEPIPASEMQRCAFWDEQPVSKFKFVSNLCRQCGKAQTTEEEHSLSPIEMNATRNA